MQVPFLFFKRTHEPTTETDVGLLVPLFGGAVLAVFAVFDIKYGTEVLCCYGDRYWRKRV